MTCEKISERLVAYMDGRASAEDRRIVEPHLATCPACRGRLGEYRKLWNVLDELPVTQPSPSFDARVRASVAAEPRPSFWSSLVPAPRLALSFSLLAAFSVWMVKSEPPRLNLAMTAAQSEQEFRMIKDLNVLENYDVLTKLDALSDLPAAFGEQEPQPDSQQEQGNGTI